MVTRSLFDEFVNILFLDAMLKKKNLQRAENVPETDN